VGGEGRFRALAFGDVLDRAHYLGEAPGLGGAVNVPLLLDDDLAAVRPDDAMLDAGGLTGLDGAREGRGDALSIIGVDGPKEALVGHGRACGLEAEDAKR